MTDVIVHQSPQILAAAAAARLITVLVDAQSAGRTPRIVLTGGGTGIAVLTEVHASPARAAVDWGDVEIFWGDERFVASADPERNDLQARDALLDAVPVDPARVHAMAARGGEFGDDVDAAAAAYAAQIPSDGFDVLMLGVGPEGHVASIFPDSPTVHDTRPVVAVRDCPKPPPTRISLTLPTIRTADQVWLMTTGQAKAQAVARALRGAAEIALPAAGATGKTRTLYLLDEAAAAEWPGRPAPTA